MRLLVSVANGADAAAARDGGADLIDAKDPSRGALGALSPGTFRHIHLVVAGTRPVTAALGDAADEDAIERLAFEYAAIGGTFVKVGFAGITSAARAASLTAAAVRGAREGSVSRCGVVAVAYADAARVAGFAPDALVDVAARAGAMGVLLDTADKSGPGLSGLMGTRALSAWVAHARQAGLLVALAGRLTLDDLPWVGDCGADIAGVRGAACNAGRTGRVTTGKVRLLRARIDAAVEATMLLSVPQIEIPARLKTRRYKT